MKTINQTILRVLLVLSLALTCLPNFSLADSDTNPIQNSVVIHAQDEMNTVIPTEKVYALREALNLKDDDRSPSAGCRFGMLSLHRRS